MSTNSSKADVQDLVDHLADYLQRVEAGETIIVTREGTPVGRLGPVRSGEPVAFATFDRQLWNGAVLHASLASVLEDLPALLDEWA